MWCEWGKHTVTAIDETLLQMKTLLLIHVYSEEIFSFTCKWIKGPDYILKMSKRTTGKNIIYKNEKNDYQYEGSTVNSHWIINIYVRQEAGELVKESGSKQQLKVAKNKYLY